MKKMLKELGMENADLRAQAAIDNVRMVGMADEIDDLRAHLAEARNKALEDVVSVVRNMNFELSNREGLVKRIRDLLDSS